MLTPRWPYPVAGGDRLRIWQLAREVARSHDITLVSLCQTEAEMQAAAPDDGAFMAIHRVLHPRWRSWLQMAVALAGRRPMQMAYYDCPDFAAAVARILPGHDLVWCHLARMAPYAQRRGTPTWLEMTDAISLTMRRAARVHARWSPVRWLFRLEASRMRRLERQLVADFDLITLISEVDRSAIMEDIQAPARIVVAPNGVDSVAEELVEAGRRSPGVALLGRMDSIANRDALRWFTAQVWPGVLQQVPQARLHVIGHVPTRDVKRLRGIPGVVVEGVVPSLLPVLAQCRVGVCPVRIGAGMQNKLLDYMAHGLAAVTSPIGLEGLGAVPDVHLMVADSATQWTAAVVRLLTDGSAATAIGRNGRTLVAQRHRWPESLAPAVRALDDLLAGSTRSRAP